MNIIKLFEKYWINIVFSIIGFAILIIGNSFNHNFSKYCIIVSGVLYLTLAIKRTVVKPKLHFTPVFSEKVKNMSEQELKENLEYVKELLEESQGDGIPEVHKKNLKKLHTQEIEIIQAEIDKRSIEFTK